MRWKMAENSLFAILLRNPWWISAAIAAGFLAMTLALFPTEWRWYGAFLGAPFTVVACIALYRQLRAPSTRRVTSTLEAVRAMSWSDFSSALESGFRRDGYDVRRLAGAAADFEIAKEGRRAVVSGKRWKVARTGVDPKLIEDVIFGCVSQSGAQSGNVARNCVLSSNLPESVPGTSVDRQCGSGQQALHFAVQAVMSETQDIVIAGGVESMSKVPIGSNIVDALKAGHGQPWDGERITARYPGVKFNQFTGAEMLAKKHKLTTAR